MTTCAFSSEEAYLVGSLDDPVAQLRAQGGAGWDMSN